MVLRSERIKLEPFSFCCNTSKSFRLEPIEMSYEDFKFLLDYGESVIASGKVERLTHSYMVIEKMSIYMPIIQLLKKLSESETEENLKKFALVWKTQEAYIKEVFHKMVPFTLNNLEEKSPTEVIQHFIKEIFKKPEFDYYSDLRMHKHDFERIITFGKYAELKTEIPEKEIQDKKKIKI